MRPGGDERCRQNDGITMLKLIDTRHEMKAIQNHLRPGIGRAHLAMGTAETA